MEMIDSSQLTYLMVLDTFYLYRFDSIRYDIFLTNILLLCANSSQGYFASWATVVTAAMALGFTASAFQTSVKGLGALMGLLASSIIVIIALIDWVGGGIFRAESIYAMVVACITVVLVLAHIYKEKKEGDGDGGGMVMFGVLAFFSVLWLVLACLVTFRGPFIATGNGYFASVSASASFACGKSYIVRMDVLKVGGIFEVTMPMY